MHTFTSTSSADVSEHYVTHSSHDEIISWGQPYDERAREFGSAPLLTLSRADPRCPSCNRFSYLCNGNFGRPAANEWFAAVIGLVLDGMTGIVTLKCPTEGCGAWFGHRLNMEELRAYREHCPLWPRIMGVTKPVAFKQPVQGTAKETPTEKWLRKEFERGAITSNQ